MKDLTTTPTAELLAEWENLNNHLSEFHVDKCDICGHEQRSMNYWSRCDECESDEVTRLGLSDESRARKESIAAELDRRTADIRNVNGFPAFGDYRQIIYAKNDPKAREAVVNIPIDELIERLKWLQMKGGNG